MQISNNRWLSFFSYFSIGAISSKDDGGYGFVFLNNKLMYLIAAANNNMDLISALSIGIANNNTEDKLQTNDTHLSSFSYLVIGATSSKYDWWYEFVLSNDKWNQFAMLLSLTWHCFSLLELQVTTQKTV